jgi:hypothetical protein
MKYAYRITLAGTWEKIGPAETVSELRRLKADALRKGYKFECWEIEYKEIEI